jgi:hypothetical protein
VCSWRQRTNSDALHRLVSFCLPGAPHSLPPDHTTGLSSLAMSSVPPPSSGSTPALDLGALADALDDSPASASAGGAPAAPAAPATASSTAKAASPALAPLSTKATVTDAHDSPATLSPSSPRAATTAPPAAAPPAAQPPPEDAEVAHIRSMFPDFDADTVRAVRAASGGGVEASE